MFPGQPLSSCGPLPGDADGAQLTELLRRITGIDLAYAPEPYLQGAPDDLQLQLEGVAHSLHRLRRFKRDGVGPDLVAEHSMGIYPALVACGSLDEGCGIEITFRVGRALSSMRRSGPFAFGCIVGLPLEPVRSIARNHGAHLANCNTSRHFLLSGKREAIEAAVAESSAAGAYSARCMETNAPLHSPLMAELEPQLREIFSDYRYAEPRCPLLDHLDQKHLERSAIASFLLRELSQPVFWERSYLALRRAGVGRFIEAGAGEPLKKFNRWIDAEQARAGIGTASYLGG